VAGLIRFVLTACPLTESPANQTFQAVVGVCLPLFVLENVDHNCSDLMLRISLCDKELNQWLMLLSYLEHSWALSSALGDAELMNEPFSINSPVSVWVRKLS